MDLNAFYATVSTISFTLLGLWWVVVQSRPALWEDPTHRRMAYAISFHFLLPGMMAILSMIAPDSPFLWRTTFTLAGLGSIGNENVGQPAQTRRLNRGGGRRQQLDLPDDQ